MQGDQAFLPVRERGAFKWITWGIFFFLLDLVLLYYGNQYLSHVAERLKNRDFGTMLFGSVFGVLVHGSQVFLLIISWVLAGRGTGRHVKWGGLAVGLALSSVGIGLTGAALPTLSTRLVYSFPLGLAIAVLMAVLFQLLTLRVENWVDQATAMLLWVYSFQSLELLPSFPTNAQALSSLFQSIYGSNEEVIVASVAGTGLFLSFLAGALISTWLLTSYSIRLGQVRRIWEMESRQAARDEATAFQEVNTLDMRSLVHDLKNPLAVIKGMTLMIKNGADEPTLEKAEIMLKATHYMEQMIGEILHEDKRHAVRAGPFFDNLERHIHPFPWGEHVEMTLAEGVENLSLTLNEIRFTRVLYNILDNAWRANRTAGTQKIELRVQRNRRFLEIEILDNGPGYPPDKGPRPRKSGWGSTGLGLAFARKTVAAHGGRLTLSKRGDGKSGVRALVELPLADESADDP
ncbi:MAG: HAMP domain-containing histidine kinase [Synergistaceae bacterium]|nr:HAMP domain-containing histidine kinase [Synergistaceae bacterium]